MPKQARGYVVILVTCSSRAEAARIARKVVSERLAACVTVPESGVQSIYRWKGKVEEAREFLLVMKTSRNCVAKLRATVEQLHSYEVPEFIALPIVDGSAAYLRWLGESVG